MIKNIKAYILYTGKKSVTVCPECWRLNNGDAVRVFSGYATITRVIDRKDGNITYMLK